MGNGTHEGPHFSAPLFLIGGFGGIALDILTLYFAGFPGHQGSGSFFWFFGVAFRVASFIGLTGILACLFAKGDLKNAFVIGVAAPSILLNIAASVQKPREPVLDIPSIPAVSSPKQSSHFDAPMIRFSLVSAEAQERIETTPSASNGHVRVTLNTTGGMPPSGRLFVIDPRDGRVVAQTTPPSRSFLFTFRTGNYWLYFEGAAEQTQPKEVTIETTGVNEVTLTVTPKKQSEWSFFWNGLTDRFNAVGRVKSEGGGWPWPEEMNVPYKPMNPYRPMKKKE